MTKEHLRTVRWAIASLLLPGQRVTRATRLRVADWDEPVGHPRLLAPSDPFYRISIYEHGRLLEEIRCRTPEEATSEALWYLVDDREPSLQWRASPSPTREKLRQAIVRSFSQDPWNDKTFPSIARLKRDIPQIQAELAAYALKNASP